MFTYTDINPIIYNIMEESQKHYAKWKKSCMIPFIRLSGESKTIETEIRSVLPRAGGGRRWLTRKEHETILQGNNNILYLDCERAYITLFAKTQNCTPKKGEFY